MTCARPLRRWQRRFGRAAVVLLAGIVAGLLWPIQYAVEGPSMAPGLLPGDVVRSGLLPIRDRLAVPRRFDRWVLATADGTPVIKRVVGLPGEAIAIVAGDVASDGETVLKGPRRLAEMGSPVAADRPAAGSEPTIGSGRTHCSWPAGEVLDDEPLAGAGSILLLPVRDVGLAAIVHVPRPPGTGPVVRVQARVAETAVTWRLRSAGRYAVVAGRLDGRVVAAAWPLPAGRRGDSCPPRSCLPAGAPERWGVALPWPEEPSTEAAPDLAVELVPAPRAAAGGADATIEQAWRWRDVRYRPAADGTAAWRLGPEELFVLGDFSAGSRDSRHWGPLPVGSLRHKIR